MLHNININAVFSHVSIYNRIKYKNEHRCFSHTDKSLKSLIWETQHSSVNATELLLKKTI